MGLRLGSFALKSHLALFASFAYLRGQWIGEGAVDNRPEDDRPMYVPARRSFEVERYVPERHHLQWWQIMLAVFGALFLFWMVRNWIYAYDVRQAIHQLDTSLGIKPVAPVRPVVYAPPAPVLVGPYRLPLSLTYRLQGKVQTLDHDEYMATSSQGSYIFIPARDCQLVDGGPYCKYHGTTVTRSSGAQ